MSADRQPTAHADLLQLASALTRLLDEQSAMLAGGGSPGRLGEAEALAATACEQVAWSALMSCPAPRPMEQLELLAAFSGALAHHAAVVRRQARFGRLGKKIWSRRPRRMHRLYKETMVGASAGP